MPYMGGAFLGVVHEVLPAFLGVERKVMPCLPTFCGPQCHAVLLLELPPSTNPVRTNGRQANVMYARIF